MKWIRLSKRKKTRSKRDYWYKLELSNLNQKKVRLRDKLQMRREERTSLNRWMRWKPIKSTWRDNGITITKSKSTWTDKNSQIWNSKINLLFKIELKMFDQTIISHSWKSRKNNREFQLLLSRTIELHLWKSRPNTLRVKNGKTEANHKLLIEI